MSRQIFDAVVPEHLRWPVVRPEDDGVPRRPMIHYALVYACSLAFEFSDCELAFDLALGDTAVGHLPCTGNWKLCPQPSTLLWTRDYRASYNGWLRSDIESRAFREHDDLVWQKTLEERHLGFCDGPFTFDELEKKFGSAGWCGMRRFAVDHDMIVDSGSQIPEPDALVRSQFVEREARREKSITDGE